MRRYFLLIWLFFSTSVLAQQGQYMSVAEFQKTYFSAQASWKTLWVNKALRADIEQILGRRFNTLRLRYFGEQQRTGWILEEIGKEMPITVAVVVEGNLIHSISVLEYRESRGGEVRYPFFTRQFKQVGLAKTESYQLDKSIDGITGATLSVRALKKIATLALFCHQQTPFAQSLAQADTLQ